MRPDLGKPEVEQILSQTSQIPRRVCKFFRGEFRFSRGVSEIVLIVGSCPMVPNSLGANFAMVPSS
jgi:hypothetical protein